jgi:hypothetical protein
MTNSPRLPASALAATTMLFLLVLSVLVHDFTDSSTDGSCVLEFLDLCLATAARARVDQSHALCGTRER